MNLLISIDYFIEIADRTARLYRNDSDSDFDDFRQEILLGVLERLDEFDPALGSAENFIVSAAQQKARNFANECRIAELERTTCRLGRIPYRIRHRDAEEAEEHAQLVCEDSELEFALLTAVLTAEQTLFLTAVQCFCLPERVCAKLGITSEHYTELLDGLQTWAKNFFPKI